MVVSDEFPQLLIVWIWLYILVTHLEPDILECEVKWALGIITMNKANGGMKFQLSYLKS